MNNQNKNIDIFSEEDMLSEYDFTNGVRGKHSQQYQKGHSVTIHHEDGTTTVEHFPPENNSHIIILDADVKKYFPDSESVNSTLICRTYRIFSATLKVINDRAKEKVNKLVKIFSHLLSFKKTLNVYLLSFLIPLNFPVV